MVNVQMTWRPTFHGATVNVAGALNRLTPKRVVWLIPGVALGAIGVLIGALFVARWHHTKRDGHSPNFGLHVDLVSTGSPSEVRSYSATLINFGIVPVLVTTCDAVTDTLARESTLAYSVERREPASTAWRTVLEVSSATNWCEPFPTGIGQGRVTRRLLWPVQRTSTAPFFWFSAHTTGGLFSVGDEGRIVIFPADSHDRRIVAPTFRAE